MSLSQAHAFNSSDSWIQVEGMGSVWGSALHTTSRRTAQSALQIKTFK